MTPKRMATNPLTSILALVLSVAPAPAMEIITHAEGFLPGSHHLELRDLGFETTDLIPADESAVTSLAEAPNSDIYGGTTAAVGRACHLFVFSPLHDSTDLLRNRVKHLGTIPGHESVHHSLLADESGVIYAGVGRNELEQHPLSDPVPGNSGIVKSLWTDIKNRYKTYPGGHLYGYDPAADKRDWVAPDEACPLEDLGIPVPNNGIYALTINPKRGEIYGVTYPDGHFFVYKIKTKTFSDLGEIYKKTIYAGPDNRTLRSVTAALVCDGYYVYGSADDGGIFRCDPDQKKIEILPVKFPSVYYSVIEAFAKDKAGAIYGGTLEGYLFRFDPEKMKVANLGKPIAQLRIRALTVGRDGVIYGMAGQRSDHCRVFSYDAGENNFSDLGILKVPREPYYQWTVLQTDAMLTARDGVIYIGESERRSHLVLFYP